MFLAFNSEMASVFAFAVDKMAILNPESPMSTALSMSSAGLASLADRMIEGDVVGVYVPPGEPNEVYALPLDSYGAITKSVDIGDSEGLAALLNACPNEYHGRRDALNEAAEVGRSDLIDIILRCGHEGEEDIALDRAKNAGHLEAAEIIELHIRGLWDGVL